MIYHPKTGRPVWTPEEAGRVEHFDLEEFACPCCGQALIDRAFVLLLDKLRGACGFPFIVTSGYRCPRFNRQRKRGPAHPTGMAVDLGVSGPRVHKLLGQAFEFHIPRIGIKQRGPHLGRFVHLDIVPWWNAELLPSPCIWTYGHGRAA